jgi:multidrug efflux pump subunit AcrA (membrane-fusion protein)
LLFGLVLVLVGSVSCNALGGQSEGVTQQLVEVTRGDLTVTVSGSGNIEAPNEMKLTFSLAGQVEKIYVQEGSQVATYCSSGRLSFSFHRISLGHLPGNASRQVEPY